MVNAVVMRPLKVIARAPFHLYYEGDAERVSASNQVGDFDILPGHAEFFSMLSPGTVTIEAPDNIISFKITNGIMTVRGDQVMVFVDL